MALSDDLFAKLAELEATSGPKGYNELTDGNLESVRRLVRNAEGDGAVSEADAKDAMSALIADEPHLQGGPNG